MILLLFALILFIGYGMARGSLAAVWLMWPLCITILPTWYPIVRIGSLGITYDRVIGIPALLILMNASGRVWTNRLQFMDWVVMLAIVVDGVSLTNNQGLRPLALIQTPLPYLPYLIGRFYMRTTSDRHLVIGGLVTVMVLTGGLAIFEAISRQNLIYRLATGRMYHQEIRYGLMRAKVGAQTPLSLGTSLLLLMPWALAASRLAREGEGAWWWRLGPKGGLLAMIAAASRGALLASCVFPVADVFFRKPSWRKLIVASLLIGGAAAYYSRDSLVDLLHSWSGSQQLQPGDIRNVVIDGQTYEYTGTKHRLLLYKVYRVPMQLAGAFGFDTKYHGSVEKHLLYYFWSIDNGYIAIRMKRGYLGLLALDLMIAGSVLAAWRIARQPSHPLRPLAQRMIAGLLALTLALFTVALFDETRLALLMTVGMITSMKDLPIGEDDLEADDYEDEDLDDLEDAEDEDESEAERESRELA